MSSISNAMGIDLFPDTYVSSNHPTHVGFLNQQGIGLFRTYVSRFLHIILCIYLIRRVGRSVTSVVLGKAPHSLGPILGERFQGQMDCNICCPWDTRIQ